MSSNAYGMGQKADDTILSEAGATVRIYAPIGAHMILLPYLVRRLLENRGQHFVRPQAR